jgi:hypothetical protein
LFGTGKLMDQQLVTANDGLVETSISIYPNPTKGALFIEGFTESFDYTIIDNTGRTLQNGTSENKIDVSQLENGLYNLVIKKGGLQKSTKIVIAD